MGTKRCQGIHALEKSNRQINRIQTNCLSALPQKAPANLSKGQPVALREKAKALPTLTTGGWGRESVFPLTQAQWGMGGIGVYPF